LELEKPTVLKQGKGKKNGTSGAKKRPEAPEVWKVPRKDDNVVEFDFVSNKEQLRETAAVMVQARWRQWCVRLQTGSHSGRSVCKEGHTGGGAFTNTTTSRPGSHSGRSVHKLGRTGEGAFADRMLQGEERLQIGLHSGRSVCTLGRTVVGALENRKLRSDCVCVCV
jgi:hypothetical protein